MKRSILFPARFMTIPQITTASLPNGLQNQPYSFQFTESGGTYPFTWSATITPNTGGQFSLNPVTGILSGTPSTAETETVVVQVSDAMAPNNVAQATFTFAVNTAVVITTASLPTGTVNVPYSATLSATGGTPPYTWSMNPSSLDGLAINTATGVLSGTPNSVTTVTGTFTATDSANLPSAPVSLSLTVQAAGMGPLPPSQMFRGFSLSTLTRLVCWPDRSIANTIHNATTNPPIGPNTPVDTNTYNAYRATGAGQPFSAATKYVSGVVPTTVSGGSILQYPFGGGPGIAAGTTYTYYVTATSAAPASVEGAPGPPLQITTPATSTPSDPVTPPTPVIDPSTWIVAPALPVGGTTWTCTNTSGGAVSGTGTLGNVGCSLSWALGLDRGSVPRANINGGDIIILTAGATYQAPAGNLILPAFNGTNGWTYIACSEAPEIKPGGKLPPYVDASAGPNYNFPMTLTAAPGIGATSATLQSGNWTKKTGIYPVQFYNATATSNKNEQRYVTFTNGSNVINWNNGYNPNAIDGTLGAALVTNCTAIISVVYLPGVTAYDMDNGALAIIQFGGPASNGSGLQGSPHTSKLRMIGIDVQPIPTNSADNAQFNNFFCYQLSNGPDDNIYLDRCMFGSEPAKFTTSGWGSAGQLPAVTSTTYGFVDHGVGNLHVSNLLIHQCYIRGVHSPVSQPGQDSNAIGILGGGPICIQYSYLQAGSEGVLCGGSYVPQGNQPNNLTYRYNFNTKPQWISAAYQTQMLPGTPIVANFTGAPPQVKFNMGAGSVGLADSFRWGVTINGVLQNPSTYTLAAPAAPTLPYIQFTTAPAAGAAIVVKGASKLMFGDYIKNNFEIKAMLGANIYGNVHWNCWWGVLPGYNGSTFSVGARDQQGGGNVNFSTIFDTCPWVAATDIDIHDNISIGSGQFGRVFGGVDYNAAPYMERVRYHNNIVHLQIPWNATAIPAYRGKLLGWDPDGFLPNMIFSNNTLVADFTNCTIPSSTASFYFAATSSFYTYERFQIQNNILTGLSAVSGDNALKLNSTQIINPTGAGWNKNLTIQDAAVTGAPAGSSGYYAVPYASVGFKNFVSEFQPPTQPSDWNVVSNVHLGTDGAPVGATFGGGTLASDPFPRTRWQVIGGGNYNDSTFWANAAKFNIVDFAPFMGLEQQQGATFTTIFANIKAQAATNGVTCRCIHYADSSAQSTAGANGTENKTYTVWTAKLNALNWWIRGSPGGWPGGPIVSTWGAGNGELPITTQNNVLDAGNAIYRRYWQHFDGVLRLGNAVSQGYSSGSAFAANPNLDGYQMDNVFCEPRIAGSWGMNSTIYAVSDPTAAAWMQQAQALQVAEIRSQFPGVVIMGNNNYFTHVSGVFNNKVTLDPAQHGLWDMSYCQVCIGPPGIEQFGTTAQFMADMIGSEAMVSATGTTVFEQTGRDANNFTSTTQGSWVAADWQAARFGLAICCLRNYHYALDPNGVETTSSPFFLDEYLQQGGKFGWLGVASTADPPQTGPRVQGVWYRVFPKTASYPGGVVFMNPKGNGIQTINLTALGLTGLQTLTSKGFGDTSINPVTPVAVTSITLQDRDGRFLIFT